MDIFIKYFAVVLAFIAVMLLLMFTTKYLAFKSKKMLKGNYMHIVESLSLGVNNRLHLIKVDKDFFIISASNKNIEFLARVNIDDYEEEEIKNPLSEVIDFKSVLKKYVNGFQIGNQVLNKTQEELASVSKKEPQGTNSIKNNDMQFKSNLEKLKHLTKSINSLRGENEQEK